MKYLLVLTIVFLAACTPAAEEAPDTTGVDLPEAIEETEALMDDEVEAESAGESLTWRSQLMKFADMIPEYHVEYDMEVRDGNQDFIGTMGMYLDGDQIRIDSEMEGVESRSFTNQDSFITCTNDGSWTCFEMTYGAEEDVYSATEATDEQLEEVDSFEQVRTGSRVIAGEQATCFLYLHEDSENELCYADSGAMLYMESQTGDTYLKYVATSYSDSVSSSDFDPPATPQNMEDMMGGMMPDGFEMPEY